MRDRLIGRCKSSERLSPRDSKKTCRNPSAAPKPTAIRQRKYAPETPGMGCVGLSMRNSRRIARPGTGSHLRFSRHSFQMSALIGAPPGLARTRNSVRRRVNSRLRQPLVRSRPLRRSRCRPPGRGVWGAAVLTRVARDHPELTAPRADDARRPFLKHEHQDEADPSAEEAQQGPADATGPGKGRAAGQQETAERTGCRREQDQGDVAGDQSDGRGLGRPLVVGW